MMTPMSGTLVLQGGGAFTANDELDRRLLAASGATRVVVLPTADAYERPDAMIAAAREWGDRMGVQIEPLMVLGRSQADDDAAAVVMAATAVYLAGDSAIHLRSVLKDTPLLAAITGVLARGGLVGAVGSSAAALCDPMTDRRGGAFALGLGVVADLALMTEIESWPEELVERAHALADTAVVDLPTGSALVRDASGWELFGDVTLHGELPQL